MGYSDSEDDDSESDDEEMAYNQGRGKSSGKALPLHILPLPICLVNCHMTCETMHIGYLCECQLYFVMPPWSLF
jgi:hypothetical protein